MDFGPQLRGLIRLIKSFAHDEVGVAFKFLITYGRSVEASFHHLPILPSLKGLIVNELQDGGDGWQQLQSLGVLDGCRPIRILCRL